MAEKKLKRDSKKQRTRPEKRKMIFAVLLISFAFFGSFLIYFIMQIALNTSAPMVVVVSGSMEPNLYKGDLLFLQGVDPEDLKDGSAEDKDGDIIVFNAYWSEDPIVHRIIDKWENKSGWYFQTKGDANSDEDRAPIHEDDILGKVVGRVPYVGWVKIFLTDSGLLIPLIIILAVPLVISIILDVFKEEEDEEEKKEKKQKFKFKRDLTRKEEKEKPVKESVPDDNGKDDFDF